jgi:hypothetical protein
LNRTVDLRLSATQDFAKATEISGKSRPAEASTVFMTCYRCCNLRTTPSLHRILIEGPWAPQTSYDSRSRSNYFRFKTLPNSSAVAPLRNNRRPSSTRTDLISDMSISPLTWSGEDTHRVPTYCETWYAVVTLGLEGSRIHLLTNICRLSLPLVDHG